jgi:enoyl-CoA hydratase/carnithine racemase
MVTSDARMAVPMVRRGVIPELAAHWTLPRITGAEVAADLMLTGRLFDGAEAVRLGSAGKRCTGTGFSRALSRSPRTRRPIRHPERSL